MLMYCSLLNASTHGFKPSSFQQFLSLLTCAQVNDDWILRRLEKWGRRENMPFLGPKKGEILQQLVQQQQPRLAVEVGSMAGYSAIVIAQVRVLCHVTWFVASINVDCNAHMLVAADLVELLALKMTTGAAGHAQSSATCCSAVLQHQHFTV